MPEVLTVPPTGTEPGLCVRVVGTVSTTGGGGTKTPADGTANPTDATDSESFNMAWNGATWDRVRSGTAIGSLKVNNDVAANLKVDASGTTVTTTGNVTPADAEANPTNTVPTEAHIMVWNGTTWERVRSVSVGDSASTGLVASGLYATSGGGGWNRLSTANNVLDATTGAATLSIGSWIFNGTTWDRMRSGGVTGMVGISGDTASAVADAGNPLKIGGVARTSDITAVTNGQRVNATLDTLGKQVFLQGATNDRIVSGTTNYTTTTAADVIAAQGVGVRIVVTSILVTNFSTATNTKVEIRDGTTVKIIGAAWNSGGGFARDAGGVAVFISTANAAVTARAVTTGADVDVSISGYLITN